MGNLTTCTLDRGRRAISGIFIALIVFASLFSVGVGYYVYAGQASLSSAKAAIARQGGVQGANAESLAVTAGPGSSPSCNGCVLEVSASNSGGIPVTITAVFVTTLSGNALSSSTNPSSLGSEFLTSGTQLTGDLNVTLPMSLAIGEGTSSLTGCGTSVGCAIGIRSTSCVHCLTSGNVYVSILTSRGNTFAAQYCPSGCVGTSSTTTTITSSFTSTTSVFSSSTITTTTNAITSSTTISGFQPGTNSLVLSMKACAGTTSPGVTFGATCPQPQPPAVYSSEEVILQINVTNFAYVPMSVSVAFQSVGTNGAYVTPASPDNCAGLQTPVEPISANGGKQTYTCTFTATQGKSGGTVTFLGYAEGTYTGYSGYITSAEVLSNPIEIGNPLSSVAGPFSAISFQYASSTSQTFGNATVVSNSKQMVIWQAQLENTANASVTILDYSFLLAARVSQEHVFYIVQPISSWTSTLSSYKCEPTSTPTNNAPAGAQCSPPQGVTALENCSTLGYGCVPTGDTVTLDFAVTNIEGSATSSSGWEWQSSGGFNPPETITLFLIIEYDYYNCQSAANGGACAWHVLSQALPITGTYITT